MFQRLPYIAKIEGHYAYPFRKLKNTSLIENLKIRSLWSIF